MATRPARPARPRVNRDAGTVHDGGGSGFWGEVKAGAEGATTIFTDPGKAIGQTAGVLGGAAEHIPGVQQAEDIGSALGVLTKAETWYRAGEVVLGGILLLAGVAIVARELGMRELSNVAGKVLKNARSK